MMRRLNILLCIIFFVFVSITAESKTELPQPDYNRIIKTIVHLTKDIGSRPAGSEQTSQAIQFVSQELKSMGYHPIYQDFRLPDNTQGRSVDVFDVGTTQREIILTAHVDTLPDSPGANEDASGVAVLLELARTVRKYHIPVGVHFLFLGAEEKIHGYEEESYFSSARFMDYQKERGVQFMNGVIVIDKIGAGEKLQVTLIDSTTSNIMDKLLDKSNQLKIPVEKQVVQQEELESIPYVDIGLETVRLEWSPNPHLHSSKDTADKIERKKIETAYTLLENFLIVP